MNLLLSGNDDDGSPNHLQHWDDMTIQVSFGLKEKTRGPDLGSKMKNDIEKT